MTTTTPPGYRRERGLLWPDYDNKCARVIFNMAGDLPVTLRHVKQRRAVVQAGGNCGVWPIELAKTFAHVYTFEPDPRNYFALVENTKHLPSVHAFNFALGNDNAAHVAMKLTDREADNCGALFIDPNPPPTTAAIPMRRIDDCGFDAVDLVYLDVEGYELFALKGAEETLARCRPVVTLEDKGLSRVYGVEQGDAVAWLQERGYVVRDRINRDVVLAPC